MEQAKARGFFILTGISVFALGALLFGLILSQKQAAVNAGIFQNHYLASIQHSIDLGKNLNSYSDFLYDEIKSPRDRDSSIFVDKAQSSLRLLLSKDILPKQKKSETRAAMKALMAKSELILKHVREGDLDLARKIFEKEYSVDLKSFHMELDSHKKYLQNKSTRFFAQNFSAMNGNVDSLIYLALGAFGFCLSSFALLGWKWRSLINKSLANQRELTKKLDLFSDQGFQVNEMFESIRGICQQGLNGNEDLKFEQVGDGPMPFPNSGPLNQALGEWESFVTDWCKRLEDKRKNLEEEISRSEAFWESCGNKLKSFSNIKLQLINSGLTENENFNFAPELLCFIEELEELFRARPFKSLKWNDFSNHALSFDFGQNKYAQKLSNEVFEVEKTAEEFRFQAKKAQKELQQEWEKRRKALEEFVAKRNELFTAILVLTDPHEMPNETQFDKVA